MSEAGVFIFVVIVGLIYFLPGLVASGKPQSTSVFVLNLFLGWTLVGWVVALAWAALPAPAVPASSPPPAVPNPPVNRPSTDVDEGERIACPFCAEMIKPQAKICRFCGRDMPATG